MTSSQRKQVDRFTKEVRKAMITVLRGSGLASEDKERIIYAATSAAEQVLVAMMR